MPPNIHFPPNPTQDANNQSLQAIQAALNTLADNKPNDRSHLDRVYAVVITDLEKAFAYFATYAF